MKNLHYILTLCLLLPAVGAFAQQDSTTKTCERFSWGLEANTIIIPKDEDVDFVGTTIKNNNYVSFGMSLIADYSLVNNRLSISSGLGFNRGKNTRESYSILDNQNKYDQRFDVVKLPLLIKYLSKETNGHISYHIQLGLSIDYFLNYKVTQTVLNGQDTVITKNYSMTKYWDAARLFTSAPITVGVNYRFPNKTKVFFNINGGIINYFGGYIIGGYYYGASLGIVFR